jgi:hypothetical protein
MNATFVSGVAAMAVASFASAGFTGLSVQTSTNAQGNTVYKIFANFDNVGLGAGQNWVFLNAYNFTTVSGSMNAFHSGTGDITWVPQGSSTASHVGNDSWVSATGTHVGSGVALDPGFVEYDADGNPIAGVAEQIPNGAGWYDASPATANNVTANSIQLMQIVRAGGPGEVYTGSFAITYKVSGTTAALTGNGSFSIGVPAPGAVALMGLAGLTGRRRR